MCLLLRFQQTKINSNKIQEISKRELNDPKITFLKKCEAITKSPFSPTKSFSKSYFYDTRLGTVLDIGSSPNKDKYINRSLQVRWNRPPRSIHLSSRIGEEICPAAQRWCKLTKWWRGMILFHGFYCVIHGLDFPHKAIWFEMRGKPHGREGYFSRGGHRKPLLDRIRENRDLRSPDLATRFDSNAKKLNETLGGIVSKCIF